MTNLLSADVRQLLKLHSHSVLTRSARLRSYPVGAFSKGFQADLLWFLARRMMTVEKATLLSRSSLERNKSVLDGIHCFKDRLVQGDLYQERRVESLAMNKKQKLLLFSYSMALFGILAMALWPATAAAQQTREVAASASVNVGPAAARSNNNADRPAPTDRNPRYKICRDDVLVLTFPLSPELNQKVIVQPDGFISLQNAGNIRIEGLTLPGVVEAIKKAYAGILHDPIVDVDLADFQKPFFTVLGQVGKPGQYDLRYDITVTQAIAVAGGFEPTAKTQVFLYRAVSGNWAEVHELKIKELLNGKNINEDVHLRPGDMIFVPEKAITNFRKYVPYSISLPPPMTY